EPPGGDERYCDLMDDTRLKMTIVNPEACFSDEAINALARLLLEVVRRQRDKYNGVEIDPAAALRDRLDLQVPRQLSQADGAGIEGLTPPPESPPLRPSWCWPLHLGLGLGAGLLGATWLAVVPFPDRTSPA